MTSETSVDLKEVIFVNVRCKEDYENLPEDVCESADQALHTLQNNEHLSPKMVDLLKGGLAGIIEVKIPYDTDEYRIYIYQGCSYAVWVLDAGVKKSPKKKEIPKWQKERLKERLRKAVDASRDDEQRLKKDFEARRKFKASKEAAKSREIVK